MATERPVGTEPLTEARDTRAPWQRTGLDVAVVAVLTGFIFWHLAPHYVLLDTTTVGGDTPAHNYLASHLADQLRQHGRIISWAGGWWCGFPMFQYYFCLPYVLIALVASVIPFNIAFKLVSILGMLALPVSAYAMARLMRFPRPVPCLLAVLMVPFLFVRTHQMWGVNVFSTLAGMIANSLGFALMLLAIGSAYRDAGEQRFRIRTVLLLALVIASHFFTAVMAALTLAIVPILHGLTGTGGAPRGRRVWGAARTLALEGGVAVLLMSWWLVPLVIKADFSTDFGVNWRMTLWKNFPAYAAAAVPLALLALAVGTRRGYHGVWVLCWMLAVGTTLFYFGFRLSPVFVNVRLWPFIFFALLALGGVGLGCLLERVPGRDGLVAAAVLPLVLVGVVWADRIPGTRGLSQVRAWAEWNYSGLEIKYWSGVIDELVMPLKGTSGRLANDLSEDNNRLGSSRVFELAPHLAGKPILEGGLVNSGMGSMYAYYIQSETSQNCAGYPPMVVPASFNFSNATLHLELFNVKHFIARSEGTQQALRSDARWRFMKRENAWELYELMSHDGRYVVIPRYRPRVVETQRWKTCSLEWLYTLAAIEHPVVFVSPGQSLGPLASEPRLSEAEFRQYLAGLGAGATGLVERGDAPLPEGHVWDETVTDDRIAFKTDALGQPHLIKCSYFPNWKVNGARQVFMVSPAFMLVFPEREQVELVYGSTASDHVGHALTGLGGLTLLILGLRRGRGIG